MHGAHYTSNYKGIFFYSSGVRERQSLTEIVTLDSTTGKLLVVKPTPCNPDNRMCIPGEAFVCVSDTQNTHGLY